MSLIDLYEWVNIVSDESKKLGQGMEKDIPISSKELRTTSKISNSVKIAYNY